jgi:hypothetical protein
MARRVAWAEREYMRRNPGGFITPNEIYRTYDDQVYWKKYWSDRGLPGNASTPGYSNHGDWDIGAIDWNADNIGLRDQVAAQVGLVRTVPSETWHYAVRGAPTVDLSAFAGGNYTSIEEDDMYDENARVEVVGRMDQKIIPALNTIIAMLGNDDAQVDRILDALRRENRPRVYQINQPGSKRHSLAAAIDVDQGYYRSYGSAAELANDQRLSLVAPETLQVTEAEFNDLYARAQKRLVQLTTPAVAPAS